MASSIAGSCSRASTPSISETTWGEGCYRQISVLPGRALDVSITCPAAIPKTVPIEWTIDWPTNLARYENRDSTWLLVSVGGQLAREFGDDKWTIHDGGRLLAFHPDGRMLNLSTLEIDNLDPLTISRSSSIQSFISQSKGAEPIVEANQTWIGATYTVGSMAYTQWDESQSPLTMLQDISKPAIEFGWDRTTRHDRRNAREPAHGRVAKSDADGRDGTDRPLDDSDARRPR